MRDSAARLGRDDLYAQAAAAFGPAIGRLARAYERDPERSRDLVQEIHVALWRSFAKYDGRCSLRTWVYRVAHNTAMSKVIRPRASTPPIVPIEDDLESLSRIDVTDAEDALDHRRAIERLYELVQRLRPLDRQVILLYLEEMDAASIAEITGISAANVATKVRRIKQLLARQFRQRVTDED
jgi:RNA polymerase sigma-70 factor (ECF subfamily)